MPTTLNIIQRADERAQEIIRMQQHEEFKAANFRNLYQQVADLMYPCENQITSKKTPGEDKSLYIRDPTAMLDSEDMASGLIGTWIPGGQNFFGIRVKKRELEQINNVRRWLALATQIAHDEMFESNFILQLNETVRALIVFGTNNIYSEWDNKTLGLNYKDWHISTYTIKQNAKGQVDTVILKYELTARQASEEFERPGEQIWKDVEKSETESKLHTFIHIVRPRIKRNVQFVDNLNMPLESVFVNVKEQIVVEEGGFEEMPYAVARWRKSSSEKYGRGQGTMLLSCVKELQQMHLDFVECGNRWNNPPREVKDNNIEGEVSNSPNALNHVTEIGSIKALDQVSLGSFPITREMLEFQQEIIHKGFFKDIFVQLSQMKGDRRTTVEIEARIREGLRRLVSPVARMESELFTPLIIRSILILIRNGRIPYPPLELQGEQFGIEYMGELAMAMRTYQARAFNQFASLVVGLEPSFPEAKDTINMDRALPDIALSMDMKVEHLSTQEEIAAKRQARQADIQQQKLMAAAQVASRAYGDTSKKAEEGSPAAEAQEALVGV
jgi:hypothetical protein